MNIGDQPAFPRPEGALKGQDGMNYRQWLIGMLASGEAASGNVGEVGWLLRRADAIIAAQEMEQHAETEEK